MATIVNTPAASHEHVGEESRSSAMNLLIGILVILAIGFLLFYFGLPMIRSVGGGVPQQINNNAPPQVNVPDKVNVDVNAPQP